MADIKKTVEEVISNYTIKQEVKSSSPIGTRYILTVAKYMKQGDKTRSDHQVDIENALKKKLGDTVYKKVVNVNGRIPIPGSKSFLATTIEIDKNKTYIIGLKEEAQSLALLPGKINPKNPVIGVWLTAEEMKYRIMQHINNNTTVTQKEKKAYDNLLSNAMKPTNNAIKYEIPKNENNATFFELVSAINLATLLKAKNSYITDNVLDLPPKYKSILGKKPIKIKLPTDSTYELLDFFIDFKGVADSSLKEEEKEQKCLRISVKAKLSAAKTGKEATGDTNTIKFKDLFDSNLKLVDKWYNELSKWNLNDLKKNQYGPKQIAYYGVESDITNIGTMYPIKALGKLLSTGQEKTKIKKQLEKTLTYFGQKKIKDFKTKTIFNNADVTNAYIDIIVELTNQISSLRKDDILDDKIQNEQSLKIVKNTLGLILNTTKVKPDDVKKNVANIGVICERVLQNSSAKDSEAKYNFYYMFYDQVLATKHVIYAVPTRIGSDAVKFKYLAKANWLQEYKDWQGDIEKAWVGLRGKSNANHLGDYGALGISV